MNKKGLPVSGGLMAGSVFSDIVDYMTEETTKANLFRKWISWLFHVQPFMGDTPFFGASRTRFF